jgi:diguanylate cyclase (GGDEF)-like protein
VGTPQESASGPELMARTGVEVPTADILVVEGIPGDAALIRLALDAAPSMFFRVTEARQFVKAIDELGRRKFDAILLDLGLPDVRGVETLQRALEAAPHTPVVVMTGMDNEDLAVKAVQRGAQDYLVKGQIDARALTRTLRYAIERKRMMLELDAARERERHLATHDPLTGLANRPMLFNRLSKAVEYAARHRHGLAVLYVDLDGFKQINLIHGHSAADEVLRTVARRLAESVRRGDTVARLGGDEFVVLLSRIVQPDHARRVSQKLLEELGRPLTVGGRQTQPGASIGIAIYPGDGGDPEELVRNADAAMVEAKRAGRHCFRFFAAGAGGGPEE